VVREMAAIMTASVLAGRTGGAFAAEIAAMQGAEEIDALEALGVSIQDYLILPRVVALTAMTPLLYLYGCAFGLIGGLLVAVAVLDLSATSFINQLTASVNADQFWIGLSKSAVFGLLIALAGCRLGLRAGRSAADVGKAATGAVVAGIVAVIAVDAVFAVCANALGI
jgi:phospholipid/cholesterol/gamma-HCH transport system permease protein